MKFEFSEQIFEKNSDIKFNQNPEGAELFHADRQTDGNDEANSRFCQICERA